MRALWARLRCLRILPASFEMQLKYQHSARSRNVVSCPASFWYFSASQGVCGKARPRREWWTHCQGAQRGHRPRGARPSGVRHARPCRVVVLANMPDIPCGPRLALTRMANSETPETCGTRHNVVSRKFLVFQRVPGGLWQGASPPGMVDPLPRGATRPQAPWGAPFGSSPCAPLPRCGPCQYARYSLRTTPCTDAHGEL